MEPFSVASEQELWQAVGRGFEALFRAAPGRDVIRTSAGMLAVSGVRCPDLNCGVVWAAGDAATATRAMAGELRSRGLPGILLVADSAGPEAHAAAESIGMIAAARMPLMTLSSAPVARDSRFTIRRAASPADLAASNRLTAAAFELPVALVDAAFGPQLLGVDGATVEIVYDEDDPVGSLQTTSTDTLLGIWSMATPPAHRRRGIAREGLTQVLTRRFAGGVSLAFLVATEAGRPLYDALEFRVVAWSTAWAWVPDPSS